MDLAALEADLTLLGLRNLRRVAGGWQSLAVYGAWVDGRHVAVKVLDPSLADRHALDVRLDALSRLGTASDMVCTPMPIGGRLLNEITADPVYAVAYQFAEGDAPDINHPEAAVQMGRVLAELHAAMASLPAYDLPALAAFPPPPELRRVANDLGVPTDWLFVATPHSDGSPRQVLHGDFSSSNVRVTGVSWRIFDFEDCGYGPVELDLANSLYFVLFDAMTSHDQDRYRRFRDSFLGGYRDWSGVGPADAVLDTLITRRVLALASWLTDPDTAPPGVRTASDEWRMTLGAFVQRYLGTLGYAAGTHDQRSTLLRSVRQR